MERKYKKGDRVILHNSNGWAMQSMFLGKALTIKGNDNDNYGNFCYTVTEELLFGYIVRESDVEFEGVYNSPLYSALL